MFTERIQYTIPYATIKVDTKGTNLPVGPLGHMHLHSEIELLYITKGSLQCHTEHNVVPAQKGDVLFVNSHIPHFAEILKEGTDFIMVQFGYPIQVPESFQYLVKYLSLTAYPCHVFHAGQTEANFLISKILALLIDSQMELRSRGYLMNAKKYELLAFLHQNEFLTDASELLGQINCEAVLPMVNYINDHYSEPISLYDVSSSLNLHPNYLCRLFKKNTGKTLMDYLNFVRICKAETLLNAGHSVAEVAELTGFSSQSYFNKVFKKHLVLTPSEYKKQRSLLYS